VARAAPCPIAPGAVLAESQEPGGGSWRQQAREGEFSEACPNAAVASRQRTDADGRIWASAAFSRRNCCRRNPVWHARDPGRRRRGRWGGSALRSSFHSEAAFLGRPMVRVPPSKTWARHRPRQRSSPSGRDGEAGSMEPAARAEQSAVRPSGRRRRQGFFQSSATLCY